MFLYELAIELGQRSADVMLAAESLGLGSLTAATTLDAQQVAALRAHFGTIAPTVGPLTGSAPPLPAPNLGPLVAAPPGGVVGGAGPKAPASWGPPTAAAAAAVAATPPPPPPSSVAGGPMAFGPPGADAAAWPSAPDAPAGAPAAPPPAGMPPGAVPLLPPTPPLPPTGGPAGPGGPTAPDGTDPAPTTIGGMTRGQLGALAAVGVLVVALFGWMVLNTGPSDEQKQRVEASKRTALETDESTEEASGVIGSVGVGEEPGEGVTGTDAATPKTTAPPTTEPTSTPEGPDPYEAVDVDRFCAAAVDIAAFELRFSAAAIERDRAGVLAVVDGEGASWDAAVTNLRAGAPPDNHEDIDTYHAGYLALFEAIRSTDDLATAYDTWGLEAQADTVLAAKRFSDQINFLCS